MPKVSPKFRKVMPLYRLFGGEEGSMDYSDGAAYRQFYFESRGKDCDPARPAGLERQPDGTFNGYSVGQHWMGVTVAMWKRDIADGLLFAAELYADPDYAGFHWWLNRVLGRAGPPAGWEGTWDGEGERRGGAGALLKQE